jgi:hypothetical protein
VIRLILLGMDRKVSVLPASINSGMSSDECAIGIMNYKGALASGFFAKEYIRNGMLEVKVVDEKADLALVRVPGQFISDTESAGEGCYITIRKEELVYS